MLALDVARIEAGLILLDVDYVSARKALIPSQQYSPYEIGLGRLVNLEKAPCIGQQALRAEAKRGPGRQLVGLEVDWDHLDRLHDAAGLPRSSRSPPHAWPYLSTRRQQWEGDQSTWSPTLKKMIALATLALIRRSRDGARDGAHGEHERSAWEWRSSRCRSSIPRAARLVPLRSRVPPDGHGPVAIGFCS